MRLSRVALTATAIASVGVLTAVTIPALAGTDHDDSSRTDPRSPAQAEVDDPAAGAPPAGDADLAPELLTALRRDLGLTEEQARARLRTEAWASRTAAALRGELGERYAGAWLNEGAEDLMIAVTDAGAADQVRAAGAEPELVRRGEAELASAKAALDQHADRAANPVAGWYVDVSGNQVVIITPSWAEPAAWAWVDESGVARDGVRVALSDEQPRLLNDVRGGDAYFIDGSARCSVGFSVVGGFVTAGHCALGGSTTTGFNEVPQGEFVAASFPGVGLSGPDDWGVVAVNEDWFPQPVVNDFEGGTLPVAGSDEAPVGASICKYGSTTGVSCGLVQAKDATVNYPEGTVTGLTRTNVCAEPGDSGGAWLSGDQAQGITSGGSGDCTAGGVTFFQPLNEVLERNELTLVTTGGEAEPPPDGGEGENEGEGEQEPPATGVCEESEHTFQGQLTRQRTVQVQPDGRFYRALSPGTHTVCLSGPDNADFALALQRWTGEQWQTVASATGPGASEQLTFDGGAGFYRIGVVADDGAGRYLVGLSFDAR